MTIRGGSGLPAWWSGLATRPATKFTGGKSRKARRRWPVLAGIFAVGAAVGVAVGAVAGAAGVTAMDRLRPWDGDGPATDPVHPHPSLDSTADDEQPNGAGATSPDLAVSISAPDMNNATTSPAGV